MPSPFDQFRKIAVGSVDSWMSEAMRHFPLAKELQDPERAKSDFVGRLHVQGDSQRTVARDFRSAFASGEATAFFSKFDYPNLHIRQGDKVQALDRTGQPFFRVGPVSDAGTGRIMVSLEVA